MMDTTAWAAFGVSHAAAGDVFYIRFNRVAARLLKDVDKVYIKRTQTGSHIILEPVPYYDLDKNKMALSIAWYSGKYPVISCTKIVDTFLSRRYFDGRRCKVKRGKAGAYICMNEIIEREDENRKDEKRNT